MARGRVATEPEHELIRKVLPFAFPALGLAVVVGFLVGGWSVAWSAAVGILIVTANFTINGLALAKAAKHSLTAISAVAMGGFVVRLGIILAIMFALNTIPSFSPVAFALAVIPATVALLVYEMKLLSGPIGQQWQIPEERTAR